MIVHHREWFGRVVHISQEVCKVAPLEIDRALASSAEILTAKVTHWERRADHIVWYNAYESSSSRYYRTYVQRVKMHFPFRKIYALRCTVFGSAEQATNREED